MVMAVVHALRTDRKALWTASSQRSSGMCLTWLQYSIAQSYLAKGIIYGYQ